MIQGGKESGAAMAASGELSFTEPLATNEKPGTWTVRVRDVLTGMADEAKVSVGVRKERRINNCRILTCHARQHP